MGSLTISTFLYASLTAHIEDLGTAAGLLLLDGVTFGISALSFFYALTLMTHENPGTRRAARAAYWVVVIVGPAVVLRFLVGAAQGAWNLRCFPQTCPQDNYSPPLLVGLVALGLLLPLSILISKLRIFEEWDILIGVCNKLCARPIWPASATFVIVASVALLEVFITEPHFTHPALVIWTSLSLGCALLTLFAVACGCVIGPRLNRG